MKINNGLAWDDVLLVPQYSDIKSRSEVDITSFVGGLKLHLPIVSSPMDTVTESEMVDAMNQAGGLGISSMTISSSFRVLSGLIPLSRERAKCRLRKSKAPRVLEGP